MANNTNPSFIAGHTGATPLDQFRENLYVKNQYVLPNGQLMGMGPGSLVRLNADGSLDAEFGGTPFQEMPIGTFVRTSGFKVQPDGKVIVGAYWTTGLFDTPSGYLVYRLNADGSKDTTFAKGKGWITTDPGDMETAAGMVVGRDGKITVIGTSGHGDSLNQPNNFISMSRFTAKGEIDPTFGKEGSILLPDNNAYLKTVQLQADGKILAAGSHKGESDISSVLYRFNADGTPDTSFGSGGKANYNFGSIPVSMVHAMAIQPDGKIVTVGTGSPDTYTGVINVYAVARFNTDGSLDTSFGNGGKVTVYAGSSDDVDRANSKFSDSTAESVLIRQDGSIVIGGGIRLTEKGTGAGTKFGLVALLPNGEIDTSFGNQGRVTTDKSLWDGFADNLVETRDGHLLISGSVDIQHRNTYGIFSFNADGTRDLSFGAVGAGTKNQIVFNEGYGGKALNPGIVLHDNELAAASYQGAWLQLQRHGAANAADLFSASGSLSLADGIAMVDGVVIGTVAAGPGTLRIDFNADATEALVNQALHAITYRNTADLSKNETVVIDWTFSDGGLGAEAALSAQASTEVKLVAGQLQGWIAQLLATPDPAALKQDLLYYLGANNTLNVSYLTDGVAAPLADADPKLIDGLLANIAAVADLKFVPGTTPGSGKIEIHSSAELAAGSAAYTPLTDNGADLFIGKPATTLRALLPELNQHLLQSLGLEGNTSKASVLSDVQVAALQYLYGPSSTARTGNDTYKLNANGANFLWDGKGTDTIDGSALSQDLTLHLEAGHWDYINARAADITAAGQITINFGSTFENATGGSGNDHLFGTIDSNILKGGAGNDVIIGYGGDDTVDGGLGLDTVNFAGKRTDYAIARTSKGFTVTSATSLDTISNVERLHFDNGDVALDINGNAGQLFRLYQAIFNRKPDLSGLGWWLDAVDRGVSMESVAESFIKSDEFTRMYGANATNTDLLTKIYQYALHRTPDKDGFAFWLDVLDNHKASLGSVLMGFSESQENYAQVIGSIQNGIAYTAFHG